MKSTTSMIRGLSRRSFLQDAAIATVAVAGAAAGAATLSGSSSEDKAAFPVAKAYAETTEQDPAWAYNGESSAWDLDEVGDPTETVQAELVIVGAGGSGLSAAIQAKQLGMEPVVLEKESYAGGSFSGCEGIFAVNSHWQTEAGYNYTVNEFVQDCLDYHHYTCQQELLRKYFEKSGETIQWLEDLGIEFDFITASAGSRVAWHVPIGTPKPGVYISGQLIAAAENAGVDIEYETPVKRICLADSGEIEGVIAERTDGTVVKYETSAVLICTGGYSDNPDIMKYLVGIEPTSWTNYGTPGHSADGIKMIHAVGGNLCRFPGTVNASGLAVVGVAFSTPTFAATVQPFCLCINSNGERYVKEDLMMENFCAAGQAAMTQASGSFVIFPQSAIDRMESGSGCAWGNGVFFDKGVQLTGLTDDLATLTEDSMIKSDSLAEISQKLGIDPDVLQATVDRYNELCKNGTDDDYMKDPDYLMPLDQGPFYAFRQTLMMAFTVGGVLIDDSNRVCDLLRQPIAGLYASGCDAGGLYGECYDYNITPGSQGGWAINSGRLAAESIANYLNV